MIKESTKKLVNKENLTYNESRAVMHEIMSGKATNSQIAALLTALRMKGETVEEIAAFAEIMRDHSNRIRPRLAAIDHPFRLFRTIYSMVGGPPSVVSTKCRQVPLRGAGLRIEGLFVLRAAISQVFSALPG